MSLSNIKSYSKIMNIIPNHNLLPCLSTYFFRNIHQNMYGSHILNLKNNLINKSFYTNIIKYTTAPIVIPQSQPEDHSNEFGELGGLKYEKFDLDEDELKEEEKSKNKYGQVPRKFKPLRGNYPNMIKKFIERGDFKSAEAVLEECKKNRDKPSDYMYTLLIRGFSQHGDTKTCFKYFSEMKSRGFQIKANTYTSLFNACANSSDKFKALNYLERAKENMRSQQLPMNHVHYNVLVKAYGRHNKLQEANKLIKEMLDNKMKIGISTINSLMYAANSDTESGLKHILRIWQLLRKEKIPPDIFTYNLLLRGIRDTHFGNCSINDLLISDEKYNISVTNDNKPDLLLYPPLICSLPMNNIHKTNLANCNNLLSASNSISKEQTKLEDLTAFEKDSEILPASIINLDLDAILKQNKLILFGGASGFLKKMESDRIEPNIKTLTFLIELVPNSTLAEEMIIKYAKSRKIVFDVDFFNMLIKKRALRGSKSEAKSVLDEIHKADLKPNIVTYGVLALTCTKKAESRELLQSLKSTGLTINKYIVDCLLESALNSMDFLFILEIMEKIWRERVRLDEVTFEKLDEFQQKMTDLIKTKQRITTTEKFRLGFSKFNMRYKTWQKEMGRTIIVERE